MQTRVANWLSVLAYRADQTPVNLAAAPFPHAAGVFSLMATLRSGRLVILPRPDPVAIVETIERERVTELFSSRLSVILGRRDGESARNHGVDSSPRQESRSLAHPTASPPIRHMT